MSLPAPLGRVIVVASLLVPPFAHGAPSVYDPLAVASGQPRTLDLAVVDAGRGREIPRAAFWDAWLREDEAARRWLDGDGPRSLLAKGDRWQRK